MAIDTVTNEQKLTNLSQNVKKMGLHNSADVIANEVIKTHKTIEIPTIWNGYDIPNNNITK